MAGKSFRYIMPVGLSLFLIGVFVRVVEDDAAPLHWGLMLAGGLFATFPRLWRRMRETDRDVARLLSVQLFSCAMMLLGAYLVKEMKGYWIIPLPIVAALETYVTFRQK